MSGREDDGRLAGQRSGPLAWALAILSTALQMVGLLLNPTPEAFLGLVLLAYTAIGFLIALRRPSNPIGWLWLAGSVCIGLGGLTTAFLQPGLSKGTISPAQAILASLLTPLANLGFSLILPFTFLLFPNGRLPSARWRPVLWLAILNSATGLLYVVRPGPIIGFDIQNQLGVPALEPLFAVIARIYEVMALGLLVIGPASTIVRYRGASSTERQQIKWFAYTAGVVLVLFAAAQLLTARLELTDQWQLLLNLLWVFVNVLVTASIGIAILAHRLYDIDVIIRKTLVYSAVTVLLTLVFFGTVLVAQRVVAGLTGEGAPVAVVISTLAIAALFAPLRARVQGFIDRRFYRRKYDSQLVLDRFAATARNETDLDGVIESLVGAVHETLQPAKTGVWIEGLGGKR